MSWLANIAYLIAAAAYLPVLVYQMVFQHKNRRGWREKLLGPRFLQPLLQPRRRFWLHGVSLGEINAARQLVARLDAHSDDHDLVVSSTTDTGHARACQLYGPDRVFRYPLDFGWAVSRALRRIDPTLIVLVELEVWFNLVTMAKRRKVPVCVVNGRLTERSCRRLRLLGPLCGRMFRALRWVGAQDEATARRFVSLGVPADRVAVTGSVKWDTATVADRVEGQDELAAALGIDPHRPLWVCGSTGPAEESLLLDAFERLRAEHADLQLALVPRKPERFDEVADMITRRAYSLRRRSRLPDGEKATSTSDDRPTVLLGDTMGELRKFYALATVVFVGRSLVPMGGSDPMEVAALGKPIIVGPHMDNFAAPTRALEADGALCTARNVHELEQELMRFLRHADIAHESGTAGQQVVRAHQGATERTVQTLLEVMSNAP